MPVQSVRLPEEIVEKLKALAKDTRRSKSSFIVEALELYLAEREDLEIALARLRDPGDEWVAHEEVKRELGLE